MLDREIVAAIVAGDPDGLAAAYDRYAPGLYAYSQSLLTEPADAADAVQDTFIIAAAKLSALRDQDRLRPWLYAVARNECRRRLRTAGHAAPLDEAAEVTDDTNDLGSDLEHAELREVGWSALGGLTPSEREIIELNLGHELTGADLADALGVPRNQAHAMASRARAHYESALGVLLVARSGRDACPELAGILEGWDGRLTVLLRKRVGRHIRRCDVCGDRQHRELSPVALLSVLPVAALPAALRHQVLGLIADGSPAARGPAAGGRAAGRHVPARGIPPAARSAVAGPAAPRGALRTGAGRRRRVAGAAIVGGVIVGGGLLPHPGPAGPPDTGRAQPTTGGPPASGPVRGRPRPARGRKAGRGSLLPRAAGAAHRQRRGQRWRQHRSGRVPQRPGHLGGAVARDIRGGRGHADRVAREPWPQAVSQRPVDRDADPHRPRRAGLRLPSRRACAPAPGTHRQPGLRVAGRRGRASRSG